MNKIIMHGIADLKRRAKQGNVDAQYDLGWAYFKGVGVNVSSARANFWFEKSALQGHGSKRPIGTSVPVFRQIHCMEKNLRKESGLVSD